MSRRTPAWLLVTRREILSKLTDKAFMIGTLTTVLMIAAAMAFMAYQAGSGESWKVAATPDARDAASAVAVLTPDLEEDAEVEVVDVADREEAEQALRDDEVDAWLHPADDGWTLTYESGNDGALTRVVSSSVAQWTLEERAVAAGTTVAELQGGTEVTEEFLRGDAERAQLASVVGFAFAFLFYLAAIVFGMQLANSVVEEKQSRIVEIIAAAIPLRQLLAGKVLGNTVLAVLQIVIYVAVGLVGLRFTPYASFVTSLTGPTVWFVVFFLLGFLALACMWAVAGSLASRTEDLQSTATPVTTLLVALFIGALALEGRAQVIASFVPPMSAILMPQRILAGTVEWWEPVVAIGLLGAFAGVLVLLGERIYRRSLLQTGGKVSMRQAWTASE